MTSRRILRPPHAKSRHLFCHGRTTLQLWCQCRRPLTSLDVMHSSAPSRESRGESHLCQKNTHQPGFVIEISRGRVAMTKWDRPGTNLSPRTSMRGINKKAAQENSPSQDGNSCGLGENRALRGFLTQVKDSLSGFRIHEFLGRS